MIFGDIPVEQAEGCILAHSETAGDRVLVVSAAPVIVSTDMFGLTDELGELRAGTAPAPEPGLSPAVAEALARLAERVETLADSLETAVTKA